MGPAASQIAIKQLGTNGGGFFNVNSAHPFENPTPLSQLPGGAGDPADLRRRCATRSARWSATRGKAGRCWRRCCVIFVPLLVGLLRGRSKRAIRASTRLGVDQAASDHASRRQHGRQRSPLRHRQLGAVGDGDDGRLQRQRQLDARFVHAAGRPGADVADAARRSHLRRRRQRALRHAGLRHRRRLRRRADGRPHAGVSGQEDRSLRDEDGGAGDPDSAAASCWSARRSPSSDRGWSTRPATKSKQSQQPRRARLLAKCCTPSRRRATTTAAPSPA